MSPLLQATPEVFFVAVGIVAGRFFCFSFGGKMVSSRRRLFRAAAQTIQTTQTGLFCHRNAVSAPATRSAGTAARHLIRRGRHDHCDWHWPGARSVWGLGEDETTFALGNGNDLVACAVQPEPRPGDPSGPL